MNATLPHSSRPARCNSAPDKLDAHRPRVRDFDAKLVKLGFRPATPEESRIAREAIARTDAKIARQLAVDWGGPPIVC